MKHPPSQFSHRILDRAYDEYFMLMARSEQLPLSYEDWKEFHEKLGFMAQDDTPPPSPMHTFPKEELSTKELLRRTGIALSAVPDPGIYEDALIAKVEERVKTMSDTDTYDKLQTECDNLRSDKNELFSKVQQLTIEVENLTTDRDRAIFFKQEAEKETNRIGRLNQDLQAQFNEVKQAYEDISERYKNTKIDEFESKPTVVLEAEIDRLTLENADLLRQLDGIYDCDVPTPPGLNIQAMVQLFERCGEAGITVQQAIDYAGISALNEQTPRNQPSFPHYFVQFPKGWTHGDVYWVLQAFRVTNPSVQHAVKKLLAAGLRGAKDQVTDLQEAADSLQRAIELEKTK